MGYGEKNTLNLRTFIDKTRETGDLVTIQKPVDPYLEMAPVIAALDGRPVLFEQVAGSEFRVLSGQCSDRRYFALALGCQVDEVVFRLADAYRSRPSRRRWSIGADAPCQQVVMAPVDLQRLPFLTHYADDAGPYATAAIAIVNDPDSGPNVSFHRCLRLDSNRLAARIVERRGTDRALKKTPSDLPVAICIGLPLHVLLAASMAPDPGVDELAIAQALAPTPVVEVPDQRSLRAGRGRVRAGGAHHPPHRGRGAVRRPDRDLGHRAPAAGDRDRLHHPPPRRHLPRPVAGHAGAQDADGHAQGAEHLRRGQRGLPLPATSASRRAAHRGCMPWCRSTSSTPTTAARRPRPPSAATARSSTWWWWTTTSTSTTRTTWSGPSPPASRPTATCWCGQNQPSSSLDPSATHTSRPENRAAPRWALDATIPWDQPDGCTRLHEFQRVPFAKADLEQIPLGHDPPALRLFIALELNVRSSSGIGAASERPQTPDCRPRRFAGPTLTTFT